MPDTNQFNLTQRATELMARHVADSKSQIDAFYDDPETWRKYNEWIAKRKGNNKNEDS